MTRLYNASAVDRVLQRMHEDDFGCWIFEGAVDSSGYGNVRAQNNGPTLKAHRVTYEHFVGPIPEGKEMDHLCRVRLCVNPDHLQPVTRAEHVLRGLRNQNYGKLTCIRGHLLSGENVYVDKGGGRSCNACNRERLRIQRRQAGVPERPYQTKTAIAVLYAEKVPLVREALRTGESQRSIARRLGVSRTTVRKTLQRM